MDDLDRSSGGSSDLKTLGLCVWLQQHVVQQTGCCPHPGLGGEPQEPVFGPIRSAYGHWEATEKVHKGGVILCLFSHFNYDCESSCELHHWSVSFIQPLNVLFVFTVIILSSGPSEPFEEFLLTLNRHFREKETERFS